ncbi:MAG: lpdC [Deltaproteobacteria bacterium]|nr:lpdC [Deltaproteobacteria bacterium]
MGERFDLLVVGGGPGGYTSAIRGAQKGLKIALVDAGFLGGTCLNRGCIPTKALLEDSLMIAATRRCPFMKGDMQVSFKRIKERKRILIENSRAGIAGVLKENGVEILSGKAAFVGPRTVKVTAPDGDQVIQANHIIIATGAQADYGTGLEVDGRSVWSTEHALDPDAIPRSLAVVGAGNRGAEFAVMYHNFGTRVVLIEKQKRILPRFHAELADRYKSILVNRKTKVLTRTTVLSAQPIEEGGVRLALETAKGQEELKVEKVLLTGTRHPSFEGLNLEVSGLGLVQGGIPTGPGMETAVKGIYVLGDASGPPYFAHKAIAQAIRTVDHIIGERSSLKKQMLFPSCVYGDPEMACVGLTEEEASQAGRKVRIGEFRFIGNGRAGSMGKEEGEVIIVSDSQTGEVLGVHMMGPQVTELISLATLAMQNGINVAGIKKTVFPHPGLSEAFFEAALATDGEAIHMKVEKEEA